MQLLRALLIYLLEAARGLVLPTAGAVPLFSHIPKNGGTWVARELRTRGHKVFDTRSRCWSIPCSGEHVPVGMAIDKKCANTVYTPGQQMFAVLRHPYSRAVSQWTWGHDGWHEKLGYELTTSGMNKFIQDTLSNATVEDDKASGCGTRWPWHRSCGRFLQDCHWLPQSDYIFDSGYNKTLITTLLNQSTLSQELHVLLGDPASRSGDAADEELANNMEDGVTAPVFASLLCALTEKTKDMLDIHYAVDFEKFGHLFDRTNYVKTPCRPGDASSTPAF